MGVLRFWKEGKCLQTVNGFGSSLLPKAEEVGMSP
jgi:hypothetical protein